jgi:alkylation response protein AidB-like acyl-CoA dehydrogenase
VITTFADDELAEFRSRVRDWLERSIPPRWREHRGELSPGEVVSIRRTWDGQLFDAGYAGLTWPPEFGGQGFGRIEEYVFYEECAMAGAPEGLSRVGRLMAGPTLIACGNEYQRDRYLPLILTGQEIWCQGFSEPGAGSDLAAMRSRAVREVGGYRVSGQKIWVSFAHYADFCLLLALTGDREARHRNLTMLVVDMHAPGVTVRPIRQLNGRLEFSEVFLDEVYVREEERIGQENGGWQVAMTVLVNERGMIEAATRYVDLCAAVQLLRDTAAVSGGSGSAAGLGHQVDVYAARVDALRWQVMRAVEKEAAGRDWFASMSVLKVYWSELYQEIVATGRSVAGPEHAVAWQERYLASRASTIASGTSEIQRTIIAERVLGLPR